MPVILIAYALFGVGMIVVLNMDIQRDYHARTVTLGLFLVGIFIRCALVMTLLFMLQVGITAIVVGP
ncbi:MAG TPA: hypothetical protein VFZ66_03870 [Herpetosiphonaceae bacterium]